MCVTSTTNPLQSYTTLPIASCDLVLGQHTSSQKVTNVSNSFVHPLAIDIESNQFLWVITGPFIVAPSLPLPPCLFISSPLPVTFTNELEMSAKFVFYKSSLCVCLLCPRTSLLLGPRVKETVVVVFCVLVHPILQFLSALISSLVSISLSVSFSSPKQFVFCMF